MRYRKTSICRELKTKIIIWLLEHIKTPQRLNACCEAFNEYIYDAEGNYLVDGKDVLYFIYMANDIMFI